MTRSDGAPLGAYPGQAVAYDFADLGRILGPGTDALGVRWQGPWMIVPWCLGLCVDMVWDTVLLPVDLVAWTLGAHKTPHEWPGSTCP